MNGRRLVLHPSLIRPVLLAGGDRTLTATLWMLVLLLVWGTKINLLTIITGLTIGILGQLVLVRWAKADPHWWAVYLRSLRYKSYYRAHSRVRAKSPQVRPSVPTL